MKYRGRAIVFESTEDYHARVNVPALDIDEVCILTFSSVAAAVSWNGIRTDGNSHISGVILLSCPKRYFLMSSLGALPS